QAGTCLIEPPPAASRARHMNECPPKIGLQSEHLGRLGPDSSDGVSSLSRPAGFGAHFLSPSRSTFHVRSTRPEAPLKRSLTLSACGGIVSVPSSRTAG